MVRVCKGVCVGGEMVLGFANTLDTTPTAVFADCSAGVLSVVAVASQP